MDGGGKRPGTEPWHTSPGVGWRGEVDRAKEAEGPAGEGGASGKPWPGNVKKTEGHMVGSGKPGSCSMRSGRGGWGVGGQGDRS